MSCRREIWEELSPELPYEAPEEITLEEAVGDPEEFMAVWEELGELGDRVSLAEFTGRWMRLGEHAAQLRASCLTAGLGERLTERMISGFLEELAPRWGEPECR
ncbi:hypothetical protein J5V16_07985 [Glycomyces sp. NEAU-S30]|uniref:Uncharacterized protein n=1 Tax=Glycomyces niveus TaxID=2820287 RepID=A0ABS3U1W0_9ACTN|nr:hypothetical protein [Glycomyces sp. NEAU-S30]